MLLAAVLVNALHPALEDAEIALDRVGVLLGIVEPDILAGRMVDRAVTGVLGAYLGVEAALVRNELALAAGVLSQELRDRLGVGVLDVEGAGLALALHQRNHGVFPGRVVPAALGVGAALPRR